MHEAGFDSFLTAKVLIRLSARIETEAQIDRSQTSDDEAYQTASEDGGVYLNGHDDLGGQGHTKEMSPLSKRETAPSSFSHDNQYDALSKLSLEDLSQHQTVGDILGSPTMMPSARSPFWTQYGNKLRVNGTIEEVCVIR